MKTLALTIGGMSCDHCVHAVHDALSAVAGVTVRSVSLADGRAEVAIAGNGPPVATLVEAMRQAGFSLNGYKAISVSAAST